MCKDPKFKSSVSTQGRSFTRAWAVLWLSIFPMSQILGWKWNTVRWIPACRQMCGDWTWDLAASGMRVFLYKHYAISSAILFASSTCHPESSVLPLRNNNGKNQVHCEAFQGSKTTWALCLPALPGAAVTCSHCPYCYFRRRFEVEWWALPMAFPSGVWGSICYVANCFTVTAGSTSPAMCGQDPVSLPVFQQEEKNQCSISSLNPGGLKKLKNRGGE